MLENLQSYANFESCFVTVLTVVYDDVKSGDGARLQERTMKLNPHLSFGGQCEDAFQFYERCFGGKILTMLTYGNSPMAEQVPPEWRGKIVHATLTVGDSVLMGADVLPEQYEKPTGFQLLIGTADPVDAERWSINSAYRGKSTASQSKGARVPNCLAPRIFGLAVCRVAVCQRCACSSLLTRSACSMTRRVFSPRIFRMSPSE